MADQNENVKDMAEAIKDDGFDNDAQVEFEGTEPAAQTPDAGQQPTAEPFSPNIIDVDVDPDESIDVEGHSMPNTARDLSDDEVEAPEPAQKVGDLDAQEAVEGKAEKSAPPDWVKERIARANKQRDNARKERDALKAELDAAKAKKAEEPPKQEKFDDYDDYVAAVTEYEKRQAAPEPKAEQKPVDEPSQPKSQLNADQESAATALTEHLQKHNPKLLQDVLETKTTISGPMIQFMHDMDHPERALEAIKNNPSLGNEIAALSEDEMAAKFKEMDAKKVGLKRGVPVKEVPNLPDPIAESGHRTEPRRAEPQTQREYEEQWAKDNPNPTDHGW